MDKHHHTHNTHHEHKTLKFSQEFVDLILNNKKYTTWRLWDDKNLKKGDKVDLICKQTGEVFARAELTDVEEKKLSLLTMEDQQGQVDFDSLGAICASLSRMYDREVTADTDVKVVKFNLIGE